MTAEERVRVLRRLQRRLEGNYAEANNAGDRQTVRRQLETVDAALIEAMRHLTEVVSYSPR